MKTLSRRIRGTDRGGWQALPPLNARRGLGGDLLKTSGSLTRALRKRGTTTVSLLRQQRAAPLRDETRLLGGGRRIYRMVREVLLSVDGEPWVFAHTLANGPARRLLRRAGRQALATVLFTDPQVRAGGLHYRQLPSRHPLAKAVQARLGISERLIARRAVFIRGTARLCVTEVFLPLSARQRV